MKIETFAQRQKAESIYNTYFHPYSENLLDFNLFDTISFYGAMTEKESDDLTIKFKEIGENLIRQIAIFDRENLMLKTIK